MTEPIMTEPMTVSQLQKLLNSFPGDAIVLHANKHFSPSLISGLVPVPLYKLRWRAGGPDSWETKQYADTEVVEEWKGLVLK